ncbi:MAG TPA: hypothetical protein PLA94_05970 [Myxococcota bacterium]|nr:hypothetical protein [Myxococcota bacterium]
MMGIFVRERKTMRLFIAIFAFLLGCAPQNDENNGNDKNNAPAEPDPILGPDNVAVDDGTGDLWVTIEGGSAPEWLLGAVWVGGEHVEEACDGDDTVCHSLGATGGALSFCNSHEGYDGCTGIPQLYYRQGRVSFMLKPKVGIGCWSWGNESSYWQECERTSWDTSA